MPYQFFTVPIRIDRQSIEELNRFLQTHRILKVEKQWVDQGSNSCWSFCIDYWEQELSLQKATIGATRERIDFKEQLTPEQFEKFAKLREWRKEVAQAESVPVYTVFTNEHLAQIVRIGATDRKSIESISGIGEARIAKYGDRLIAVLSTH